MSAYFASLNILKLAKNLPGGVSQGIIWGIMALGIYITFRLLDVADLTVDGSFTTGGAVTVMLILAGWPDYRTSAHEAGDSCHSCRYSDAALPLFD